MTHFGTNFWPIVLHLGHADTYASRCLHAHGSALGCPRIVIRICASSAWICNLMAIPSHHSRVWHNIQKRQKYRLLTRIDTIPDVNGFSPWDIHLYSLRGVVKNSLFTVRLTVRGVGGSAPSALTISKCENFDPFFFLINMTLWYSKHILSYCEGSQKCIYNAFNSSALPLSDRFMTEQQRQ